MGKYQQKPVMPKRSNPNETDAAKEKWDAVAATMVSSARAAKVGAAVGQDPVGQPAGQVESFIQLMCFFVNTTLRWKVERLLTLSWAPTLASTSNRL